MITTLLAQTSGHINFDELGLSAVALSIGPLDIRWYSLAYIVGVFSAYLLVRRMIRQPGAPMAERHTDDLLFWGMMGVILGGRIGYILFYGLDRYLADPMSIFRLWDGGMSFHGGLVGVVLAIAWVARSAQLNFLRLCDYIAPAVPIGMLLGRLANFVNGELWGRVTDVSWGIIFPASGSMLPRHPSQLYQAGGEGLLLLLILTYLFWRTDARYYPGRLVGIFAAGMGLARFTMEFSANPTRS